MVTTAALTQAQRYFYDVNGYVVLRGVFGPHECRRFIALADRMDADSTCLYKHDGYPKTLLLTVLSRCAWYDPYLLETALHPTLLPVIEDIVGGETRLEEHQFLINYPENNLTPDLAPPCPPKLGGAGGRGGEGGRYPDPAPKRRIADEGWHRGIAPSFGSFQDQGGIHCLFTKAFIYLTDNRSGEGTWVVPGSHRLELPAQQLRAFLDETLARQIEADAGDVLILSETLIHAGPRLRAGAPARYSLVYGYTAPFMQTWTRYDPPAELLDRVTPEQRRFLTGETRYLFRCGQF